MVLASKKEDFQGTNTETVVLSICPAGQKFWGSFYENQTQKTNFWRKLLRKSHKNQTQKTKFLEENAAKIVLFEKKTFFNFCSIFVKKKKRISYG